MLDSFTGVLKKVFGDANDREVRRIQPVVAQVAALEPKIQALDDRELAAQTVRFKERLERGKGHQRPLCGDEHLSFRRNIRNHSAEEAKDEHWGELRRGYHAEPYWVWCEFRDEPSLCNRLHPGASE
jgi:hypothetical protein